MGTPQKVLKAKWSDDVAALSAMSRSGNRTRSRKAREKEQQVTLAEAARLRRHEEAQAMIAERGGDPDD